MGNGISCCYRNTQDNVKQDHLQQNLEISKSTPTLPDQYNNISSHSIGYISKEPTIKQVHAELCHSFNLNPTSSNSRFNPPSKDIHRTQIPNSVLSKYKLDKNEKQPHSASPRKKTVISKKPLRKASSVIEMNVIQKYNDIMDHKLCEFSTKMNSYKKHNINLLYTTTINETQKININIDTTTHELNRSYTKVTCEEIQEPFSSKQIVFIKRILYNEDLLFEQMDEHIK
jgi:hypothetical protein